MTTFQERELAFEAKFAHDEEFRFLVTARRDKIFAHWMAERVGLPGKDRADLIASILALPDGPGHDERLLQYAASFLSDHGVRADGAELAAVLNMKASESRHELLETPPGTPEAPLTSL